jgi:hypothetical protein
MNFYQSEGSSRTVRIFLLGIVGLLVGFFVVIRQAFAITILSLVPIAIVALGFSIRRRKSLVAVLAPSAMRIPAWSTTEF